ncbi:hypothetical protein CDL12_18792 [Handroanthus impetiginosus]|uniref:Uncharacterized protein n=1 Tax=Handroanthus impetiginosus TaxID=429701 RepID=A0A2G9GTL7_9LAMI|nr:hypothetical protein CDL12_18792 [Handroanthus impetiginosus]
MASEAEEAAAAKPRGGRLCVICNAQRAALKRPKTLEQVCFLFYLSILSFVFVSESLC